MSALKKDTWADGYIASRTLEGIDGPGRRTVRRLEIRGLGSDSVGGLAGLSRFPDLTHLVLKTVRGVDLAPLGELSLDTLDIEDLNGGDLAPLSKIKGLKDLGLMDVSPDPTDALSLPRSLTSLLVANDTAEHSGEAVRMLVRAIDWSRLGGLRTLQLSVGGNNDLPAVGVDLSFLADLPELRTLRIEQGIFHDASTPSPLEAPFRGLSRNLTWVRIDAVDPQPLQVALEEIMAHSASKDTEPRSITVYERPLPDRREARVAWQIRAFEDGAWGVYGSLYEGLASDGDETEYQAAKRAQQCLAATDSQLAKRLDFDPEANGTGIYAKSREDLIAALQVLGLVEP